MTQFTTNQTELAILGRQTFWMPAFNNRGPIQTSNVSDTYTSTSIPTALAFSSVFIRRMMMEMLTVFLFSEQCM